MIYTQYIYYCITTRVHYSLHHNGNKVNWRGSLRKLVGVVALACLVSYQDAGSDRYRYRERECYLITSKLITNYSMVTSVYHGQPRRSPGAPCSCLTKCHLNEIANML